MNLTEAIDKIKLDTILHLIRQKVDDSIEGNKKTICAKDSWEYLCYRIAKIALISEKEIEEKFRAIEDAK